MKTAFSMQPGFFAAMSQQADLTLPPGVLRIYCARLEAYDMPLKETPEQDLDCQFTLLPALAENRPDVARALLQLHKNLEANLAVLKREAAGAGRKR